MNIKKIEIHDIETKIYTDVLDEIDLVKCNDRYSEYDRLKEMDND